jgi:hypothetical protein
MTGADPVNGLTRRGINGLAIDKHLVAGFNAQPRITGIRCDEIGQQYLSQPANPPAPPSSSGFIKAPDLCCV